jgi:non-homologous end joining protein Ku
MKTNDGSLKAIGSVLLDFGIATVPLSVYSSVREHAIKFKSVCQCGSPIKQLKFCQAENKEVGYSSLMKEYEGIVFGQDEVKKSTDNKVEILMVSQKENFDCVIPKQKPYLVNVTKDKKRGSQSKLYQSFIDWLVANDCYALVRFSVRSSEHLCLAVPDKENYNLTITPLYYGDEKINITDSDFSKQAISEAETKMSQQFFTQYYNNNANVKTIISSFEDEQNKKLIAIIEPKAKGQPIAIKQIQAVKEDEDLTKLFAKSDMATRKIEVKI